MHFAPWVDEPTQPEKRASNRLRFLIQKAANEKVASGSLAAFADYCGIDRSSMHKHISAGAFSGRMAVAIERACGASLLRAVDLTNPLDIPTE